MQRDTHSSQYRWVTSAAWSGSHRSGALSWEGTQVSTNGTRSPAITVKVASCAKLRPVSVTGVSSQSESGPATASRQLSARRTHGVTWPYPKRIRNTQDTSTDPDRPSTMRTRTGGLPSRGGMKSVTRISPVGVCHSVSRIRVSPR